NILTDTRLVSRRSEGSFHGRSCPLMADFILGCSTITWERKAPLEEMLRAIKAVGFQGAPAGWREGERLEQVGETFASFGLRPGPGYLGAEYWDRAQHAEIYKRAERHADWSKATGCGELFIAPNLTPGRRKLAGHVDGSDELPDDGYRAMVEAMN